MRSLLDSENRSLSGDADITGSSNSSSGTSTTNSSSSEETESTGQTPDNLSGISDIPSPTSQGREGAARLQEILQVGPSTLLDSRFIQELDQTAAVQPTSVVIPTTERDVASERSAG